MLRLVPRVAVAALLLASFVACFSRVAGTDYLLSILGDISRARQYGTMGWSKNDKRLIAPYERFPADQKDDPIELGSSQGLFFRRPRAAYRSQRGACSEDDGCH